MPRSFGLILLSAAFAVCCLRAGALAQPRAEVAMDPPLAAVFPVEKAGDGVHVRFPVLISNRLIVRPDSVLRLFYTPPPQQPARHEADDDKEDKVHTGAGRSHTQNYNSANTEIGGEPVDLDAKFARITAKENARQTMEAMRATVWTNERDFKDFLATAKNLDFNLVFKTPGAPREEPPSSPPPERGKKKADPGLRDESLDFPKGLFLGQPGGKVVVLSIEKGGAAFQAGLRPGDEIVAFNNQPLQGSLEKFVSLSTQAQNNSQAFNFTVQRANAPAPLQFKLPAPISLKGSMLDQP